MADPNASHRNVNAERRKPSFVVSKISNRNLAHSFGQRVRHSFFLIESGITPFNTSVEGVCSSPNIELCVLIRRAPTTRSTRAIVVHTERFFDPEGEFDFYSYDLLNHNWEANAPARLLITNAPEITFASSEDLQGKGAA
jgi:hypothetical protein